MKNTFTDNPAPFPSRPGPVIRFGLTILLLVLLPNPSNAAETIKATYTKSSGTELVISITITPPAPASIILMQKLPPGTRITHAQPAAKNINTKKGQAKWLLKKITPGTRTIRMSLDRTVTEQDITAMIRYKPAKGGKMLSLPVKKPFSP